MSTAGPPRMQPAEEPDAYPQPTPRLLYVHDDLSDEVERRLGAASPAGEQWSVGTDIDSATASAS